MTALIYLHIVNSPSAEMMNTNMLATTIPAIALRLRPETTVRCQQIHNSDVTVRRAILSYQELNYVDCS